ncbi:MAG TPA: glucosaminidase domain-containing protein [Bacteroidia bacterium]|nr:glucosaminidase domain-containing protein [Bacteroidia bacterium]
MKPAIILISLLFCQVAFAQPDKFRMTRQDYIEKYKNDAIKDMQKTGVPASITLAQGLFESESGNSELAREANNHFGIKCHNEWTGETFHKDDDEKNECFRKYNSVLESFDDHSAFLRNRSRYAFLFDLDITDYKGWARGLKKAGYATNPEYAQKLIKIIEDFQLYELEKGAQNIPLIASAKNDSPKPARKKETKSISSPGAGKKEYQHSENDVPFVLAKAGDSYFSIANENNIRLWQVLKYNDAEKTDIPEEGETVYIMPKRSSAKEKFHIVKEGEDIHYISQLYAVKLKKLYRRNHLSSEDKLTEGQKILLK